MVNDKLNVLSEEHRNLVKGFRVNPNLRGANAAWNNTYKTIDVSSLLAAKKLESSTINHEVRHAILDNLIINNRGVVDDFASENGRVVDWVELEKLAKSYKNRPNTIVEAFNIKYAKLSEAFAKAEVTPQPTTPSVTPPVSEGEGKPRTFYRGQVPGEPKRIPTVFSEAEGKTFVARTAKSARNYGENIETITAKPDARILYTEDKEFWRVIGKRKPPNMSIYSLKGDLIDNINLAIAKAKEAGYDAISFHPPHDADIGTIILNDNAFIRETPVTPEVTRAKATITQHILGEIRYIDIRLEGRPSVSVARADEGLSEDVLIERAKKYWDSRDKQESIASNLRAQYNKQVYVGTLPTSDVDTTLSGYYAYVLKERKKGGKFQILEAVNLEEVPLAPTATTGAVVKPPVVTPEVTKLITYQGDEVGIGEMVNFGAFGDRGILVGGTAKDAMVRPIQTKEGKLTGFKDAVNVKDSFRKIHEPLPISPEETAIIERAKQEVTAKFAPRPLGEEGITMAGKGKEVIPAEPKISEPTIAEPSISEPTITEPTPESGTLLARNQETRLSAETGEPTEFKYEWYMRKGKKYPVEVHRVFTKNEQIVADDLISEGMTPAEAAQRISPETSYQKAEKFSYAKSSYEKDQKEIESKKQAEQAKAEEIAQDKARFEETYKQLSSTRGLKPTTIKITAPEGNPTEIEGYDIGNGIGVAKFKVGDYSITHLGTGLAMGHTWQKRSDAVALAKAIAKVGNWTQYTKESDVPREMIDKASALVRAFTQRELSSDLAGDITTKVIPATKTTPKRESILSGEPVIEESREFASGETAGWKVAEKLLEAYPIPSDDEELANLINKAHYSPYAPELPKYLKENEEQHKAYGMGFDYGVSQAIQQKSAKVSPKPKTEPTISEIPYSADLDIRNIESLPRGTGAKYLVTLKGALP